MEICEETVVMPVIKMTRAEERALWNTRPLKRLVCGKRIQHWLTDDGQNEILLEGEAVYRKVWIPYRKVWIYGE